MSFHSPHLLWLLVPLVLLFSWELARHTASANSVWPKIRRAWAGSFSVSLGVRHTTAETRPRIWLWFGLACCIVSLARPQWGSVEEQVFDQSREVLIALDLSRSMLSTDVRPSRLDRAKLLISSLLDGLKGERVGLVLFSGTAFLQSPLSADYEVLREFLPALKPDYLPEGGTNYQALLSTSMQAFSTSVADRYLIILSDGEATDEDWKPLIEQLKAKGIRVIGLGIGTSFGSFIPDGSGGFVKDERGAVVMSRLNSSTLQELAQITGGAYSDASSWVDLGALLKQTVDAGKKGNHAQKNTVRKIERYQWFLAPGLLLLFLSYWTEFPVRPRARALPLGRARTPKPAPAATAAALLAGLVWLGALGFAPRAPAAPEPAAGADNALAAPLSKTVERLAAQDDLTAKDCAELAQTTVTYGERMRSSQQLPQERAVRDALAAVDQGRKQDAKAADWPQLQSKLEALLKKPEEQKKPDEKKQDEQKKDDQQKQQQDQQQKQDQSPQSNQDQQQKPQDNPPKPDQPQNQPPKQDAFGKMQDKPEPPPEPPKSSPRPPQGGTQKVGGQKEKPEPANNQNPEMAAQLQKLQQVKDLDSPAKFQQLLMDQPSPSQKPAKDW